MSTTAAKTTNNTSYHDRRLARRLEDPEFRAEYERASREIEIVDRIVNALDELREDHGLSKKDLADYIGKNPASVRRLFTTSGNPELRTVVALADALDADVKIVPRKRKSASRGSAITRDGKRLRGSSTAQAADRTTKGTTTTKRRSRNAASSPSRKKAASSGRDLIAA